MSEKVTIILTYGVIAFLVVLLVTFITMILYLYAKRQYNNQQQMENLKNRYAQELLKAQLEMQEQTLEQISKDIHDDIGSWLSLAKLHLNTIEAKSCPEAKDKIDDTVNILTASIEAIRDLSKGLSLDMIKAGGFEQAVIQHIDRIKKTKRYDIRLSVDGTYNFFDEQKEIILFRILQESINNIIRHSKATVIDISLNYGASAVTLLVSDNGQGFAPENIVRPGGLQNIRTRAALLDAEFDLKSVPANGTSLLVRVPLNLNEQ